MAVSQTSLELNAFLNESLPSPAVFEAGAVREHDASRRSLFLTPATSQCGAKKQP